MKKDDLRQPDVFIATSNSLLHFIERHVKVIFSLIAVIVVGSMSYLGYSYFQGSKESASAARIYTAESGLKQAQKAVDEETKKKAATPRPPNFDADYQAKVKSIIAAIGAEKDSRAALLSAMNLVDFLGQNNRWPMALEVMKIPTFVPNPKELLFGLVEMHRGLVALENAQTDEAISHYQTVIANPSQKLLHAEAYLKLGISYETKKDFKKAKETYQRLIQDYLSSDSATEAQHFLKLLELKGAA